MAREREVTALRRYVGAIVGRFVAEYSSLMGASFSAAFVPFAEARRGLIEIFGPDEQFRFT